MTQVLNTILTQVLRIKKEDQKADSVSYTSKALKEELGFDLDELSALLKEKGISYLKEEHMFTNEHISILADILYEIAEQLFDEPDQHEQSLSMFAQSMVLYEFIEQDERIYSIDRNLKISKIKDYLS